MSSYWVQIFIFHLVFGRGRVQKLNYLVQHLDFSYFRVILDWLSYKVRIRVKEKPEKSAEEMKLTDPLQQFGNSILNNQNDLLCGPNKMLRQNTNNATVHVKWAANNNKNGVSADGFHHGAGNNNKFNNKHDQSKVRNSDRCMPQGQVSETDIFLSKLDVLIQKLYTMDDKESVKTEWRTVAMTIDRCLLFLFLATYMITIFGCFLTAPGYVP